MNRRRRLYSSSSRTKWNCESFQCDFKSATTATTITQDWVGQPVQASPGQPSHGVQTSRPVRNSNYKITIKCPILDDWWVADKKCYKVLSSLGTDPSTSTSTTSVPHFTRGGTRVAMPLLRQFQPRLGGVNLVRFGQFKLFHL